MSQPNINPLLIVQNQLSTPENYHATSVVEMPNSTIALHIKESPNTHTILDCKWHSPDTLSSEETLRIDNLCNWLVGHAMDEIGNNI
ncbi:hypothetical protein HOH87_03870 [bacterium]|mgnify:CR=1 FL=1|jgi:hypothetical protein|nr:hypothetical protein [bacterium]